MTNSALQWLAKKHIPVYLSSLIAFSSSQLEALAEAEGMTGTASSSKRAATAAFADPNDNTKRQRFAEWGAQVAASINRLGKPPCLKLCMPILRAPSLARPVPWCTKPHRSAQSTSACQSRWNLKDTI